MPQFKATFLPDNDHIIFDVANVYLAWQRAIDHYQDFITRNLYPDFEDNKITFKAFQISDFLKIEIMESFKITTEYFNVKNNTFVKEYFSKTLPLRQCYLCETLPEQFEHTTHIDNWLMQGLHSGQLKSISFELIESIDNAFVKSIKIEKA